MFPPCHVSHKSRHQNVHARNGLVTLVTRQSPNTTSNFSQRFLEYVGICWTPRNYDITSEYQRIINPKTNKLWYVLNVQIQVFKGDVQNHQNGHLPKTAFKHLWKPDCLSSTIVFPTFPVPWILFKGKIYRKPPYLVGENAGTHADVTLSPYIDSWFYPLPKTGELHPPSHSQQRQWWNSTNIQDGLQIVCFT